MLSSRQISYLEENKKSDDHQPSDFYHLKNLSKRTKLANQNYNSLNFICARKNINKRY